MGSTSLAVTRSIVIAAEARIVFEYVAECENVRRFMCNVGRFEPTSDRKYGLGAEFYWETALRGIKLGWEFVVSEFHPYEYMAARSLGAPHSRSSWRFRPSPRGTIATFGVECELPPIARRFGGWLIRRELSANIDRSLARLRRLLEPAGQRADIGIGGTSNDLALPQLHSGQEARRRALQQ